MDMKRTDRLSKQNIYIVLSILLPVLSIYVSPIPGLDLGTACILFFSVFLFGNKSVFRINFILGLLLFYTFVATIPSLIGLTTSYSTETIILLRMMRFVLLIIIMIGLGYSNYFDEHKYTRVFEFVAIIVAIYAMLQSVVFKFTGVKLRNIFGQVRGGTIFSSLLGEYESVYRPPSIFLEPSSVTYFLTPILCYSLFSDKRISVKRVSFSIIISAGILVSTSGQGLLVVAICWGIWGISRLRSLSFGGILVLLISITFIVNSYDFDYTISRITTDDALNAVDARAGGYDLVKEMTLDSFMFGNGYGNYDESVYYSSFAEILFCTGVLGLIIVLSLYFWLFIKGVAYQKVLVIASILLMVGGGIYTATYLCLYLPLLLPQSRTHKHQLRHF